MWENSALWWNVANTIILGWYGWTQFNLQDQPYMVHKAIDINKQSSDSDDKPTSKTQYPWQQDDSSYNSNATSNLDENEKEKAQQKQEPK